MKHFCKNWVTKIILNAQCVLYLVLLSFRCFAEDEEIIIFEFEEDWKKDKNYNEVECVGSSWFHQGSRQWRNYGHAFCSQLQMQNDQNNCFGVISPLPELRLDHCNAPAHRSSDALALWQQNKRDEWTFGMTKVCPLCNGLMSRNAKTFLLSNTDDWKPIRDNEKFEEVKPLYEGAVPATILQKMQSLSTFFFSSISNNKSP